MGELEQIHESGLGKLFNTGDALIQVMRLEGTWFEMGQQYGAFAKEGMQQTWDVVIQPFLDRKWTSEADAEQLFGRKPLASSSIRMKQFCRGVADAAGWSADKVSLLSQGGAMGRYQADVHSFSGCSTIMAWGDATPHGGTVTARNLDWSEAFLDLPLYLAAFNPSDGSNAFANLGWPGWLFIMTAVNEHGVYIDMHDGSSMGGALVYKDRASFLNATFDMMAECDHAEAVSDRMNSLSSDVSLIYSVADASPSGFSFECPSWDSRRRDPDGDTMVVVNTFMVPDWGIRKWETLSHSLKRYENLTARVAEAHGAIDTAKAMEIFDLPLFNEDGSFRENGGPTKPTKQDADLTDHQIVADLADLQVWLKIPQKTDWRHVDLKPLFASSRPEEKSLRG
jgi:hypothetical protein